MRWLAMAIALAPALAAADGLKLTPQKDHGVEFLAPAGWALDVMEDASKVVATDGATQATVTLQAIKKKDVSVGDWVKMMTQGAKTKDAAGWTCAEGGDDKTGRTTTCGTARETILLFVTLACDGGNYKKWGGLKLVQKIAASAKGFKSAEASAD